MVTNVTKSTQRKILRLAANSGIDADGDTFVFDNNTYYVNLVAGVVKKVIK